MLKSIRWLRRIIISSIVIGVVLLGTRLVRSQLTQPNPEQILGIALPLSTTNLNMEIERKFIGEYNAYLRFELARDDVTTLLADPAFQPTSTSTNPFVVIGTASRGGTSFATIVQREHPVWWDPPLEGSYLLAYRSRPVRLSPSSSPSPYTGPDASWYVIDISDPVHAIVYIYVVEV